MHYYDLQVVLQEVPGEVSLCFSISGCPLRCHGCHSPHLWKKNSGKPLHLKTFKNILSKYTGLASCVLFMGGEWHESELIPLLKYAQDQNFKTCLYTGEPFISPAIVEYLTWLKTGAWVEELGGLESPTTNQKFIDTKNNLLLNHLFLKP